MKKLIIALIASASLFAQSVANNPQIPNVVTFSQLGSSPLSTATNGTYVFCSDCTSANPTAGSGTGFIVRRESGAWNGQYGGSVSPAFSSAGKGQYWVPFSGAAPAGSGFTSISQSANVMRCIEQLVPAGGMTVSKANAYLSTADAGNYSGVAWYDVTGARLTPATTTGQLLTSGSTGISWAMGSSTVIPAGVNYVCFWSNGTASIYADSASGTLIGLIPGVTETGASSRVFDASGTTTISTSTITWAATMGTRTAVGTTGGLKSEYIIMDWMP